MSILLGPLNRVGYTWSQDVAGTSYQLPGGERMLVCEVTGNVFRSTPEGYRPASESESAAVLDLVKKDDAIHAARKQEAARIAGGQSMLARAVLMGIYYADGPVEPFTLEKWPGIAWVQVGRNSSHGFFAGVDAEGRLYHRSVDESAPWPHDKDYDPNYPVEYVRQVEDFSGYWGHH